MSARFKLAHDDCVKAMSRLDAESIDMVLMDPPFRITSKKESDWNNVAVDWSALWEQLNRIVKPNGAICVFGVQPFTTEVISSNLRAFKYTWIWRKSRVSNVLNAKKRPMNVHCEISVFVRKGLPTYNPQGLTELEEAKVRVRKPGVESVNYNRIPTERSVQTHTGYPRTVIEFDSAVNGEKVHPTAKPVPLLEYLIRTYTNEGETVLDPFMGSGSTGVAALQAERRFIGCEIMPVKEGDDDWYGVARERIKAVKE